MRLGSLRTRRAGWLAVAGVALVVGCGRKLGKPVPEAEPVVLEIHNHSFFDMDVYVVPSPSSSASLRLTTVSGFANTSVRIRQLHLQPGNALQILLHPIGARTQWYSPMLSVSPGEHVAMEINSDANGNLSRTILYPLPDTTDTEGPVPGPRP